MEDKLIGLGFEIISEGIDYDAELTADGGHAIVIYKNNKCHNWLSCGESNYECHNHGLCVVGEN